MKIQHIGMLAAPLLLLLFALRTLITTDVKGYRGFKGDYEELHSLQERK